MTPEATQHVRQALRLIEQARYRLGVHRFISLFIDHWAFQQSGLYPPTEAIPADLESVAKELSHALSMAMMSDPTSDILGYVLSESGFYKQGTSFYPTPPEVAKLMSAMTSDGPRVGQFYEPCCGTGINTIHWLEHLAETRGFEAIEQAELCLEDVDPLMIKGCMLQLLHYFASRGVTPLRMSIVGINTLSRKESGIAYYGDRQPAAQVQHPGTPVTIDHAELLKAANS